MAASVDNRDYYEVLHVSRDAPLEIIRVSYRTLMQKLKHHPDLGGDAAAAATINEAYAVLSNPERRADYDARLDVLAQLAQDMQEPAVEVPPVAAPIRILDPFLECVFCESPHDYGNVIEVDVGCRTCGSPLHSPENQRFESEGQRAVERIDKRQVIAIYTQWPQPKGFEGHTEDISLHGLRFVTRCRLRKGQRIKIVSAVLDAIADVTHCRYERREWKTVCVAGVSFTTLRFVRSAGGFVSAHV